MSSSVALPNVSQRPRRHVAPDREITFGDLAADLSADYELTLDEWQRLVLDDWLAMSGEQWSSLTCGLACPRQNGKNGIIEVRELFGMVGRGEKILHTAHEVKTARKAFKRLQHFFGKRVDDPGANFPELNGLVVELRNVNGQEAIFLANGGSVEIVARSKNSGRGFTADVLVIDEAQEMSEEDLEALMPTTSAAPLGNPQWIFTGTPPGPKVNGEVFTRTRLNSLSEEPGRMCWHEWSACDPGETVDLDDRELWHLTNPALGTRLQLDVLVGERAQFSDEGFARERLGIWEDPETAMDRIIPAVSWEKCRNPNTERGDRVEYALDASPDLKSAAISASDGRVVLVLEHHPGFKWVGPALVDILADRPGRLWLDPRSPAGALIVDLEEAGITFEPVTAAQHAQACGAFLGACEAGDGSLVHYGQPALDAAAEGATRRPYGDAWAWNRRTSTVDISPLVASTIARWAALQQTVGEPAFKSLDDYLEDSTW